MGIFETYSKRKARREKAGQPDVYRYDVLPRELRIQIIHIWLSAIGPYVRPDPYGFERSPISNTHWRNIHDIVAREIGVFHLGDSSYEDPFTQCQQFFMKADIDKALDLIEISFRMIDRVIRDLEYYQRSNTKITQEPDEAIRELNHRFREHGVGYQYVGGKIIRVDSQYVHAEVVRPAIDLLHHAGFEGASDEFLKAHDHYRHSRNKEAISEALKSFESTIKAICAKRKWSHAPGATAKELIDACIKKGLLPKELESHFSALRSTLEAGLPTVRNRLAGHGQGLIPLEVPGYLAAYAIHLAATNIVFLVQADEALG